MPLRTLFSNGHGKGAKGLGCSNPAIIKAASQKARQNRKEDLAIRTLCGITSAADPRPDAERRRGRLVAQKHHGATGNSNTYLPPETLLPSHHCDL